MLTPTAFSQSNQQPVPEGVFTAESKHFIVASRDADSAHYVDRLAKKLYGIVGEYVNLPDEYSEPIVIKLVPKEHWQSPAPFQTSAGVAGELSLHFGWDKDADFDWLVRGIVQVITTRAFVWHHGTSRVADMPYWLELALTEEARARMNPAKLSHIVETAQVTERLSVPTIILSTRETGANADLVINSFAMLRAMRREYGAETRPFLSALIGSESPGITLAQSRPEIFHRQDAIESWWKRQYNHFLAKRTSVFWDTKQTRNQMLAWTRLNVSDSSEPLIMTITQTWHMRDEPGVRQKIVDRVAEVHDHIEQANPVYFNSMLSLGKVWEAVRDSDLSGLQINYERFKNDFTAAIDMDVRIQKALNIEPKE